MNPVLHTNVSFDDAQWKSVTQLLDEANTILASRGSALQGLAEHLLNSKWSTACPNHEPPLALKEFLLRAGADAPFLNPHFEDSYRPENYQENRVCAIRFLGDLALDDKASALHLLNEDESLRAAIIVIACDDGGEIYYCMDASDNHSPVFQLCATHGVVKVESMTMLEFLRVELINYWMAQMLPHR